MKIVSDKRRLRVRQIHISNGEPRLSSAADLRQNSDGEIDVSGLWKGIVPLLLEDMQIRASRLGVSPLEWLRIRLMSSPMINVEVIGV
jgi:hypothetical protein